MKKMAFVAFIFVLVGCKSEKDQKEEAPSGKIALKDPAVKESYSRGAKLYNNFCAACHLSSGEGIANTFPPVNQSNWLTEKRKESIRAIKYGLKGPIEVNGEKYNNLMPDLGLSDEETRDVLNYIFYAWDNNIDNPATLEEVKSVEP